MREREADEANQDMEKLNRDEGFDVLILIEQLNLLMVFTSKWLLSFDV